MPKSYHGEGHGPPMEALKTAINKAWEEAKAGGAEGKKLRVEWHVKGENPINWTGVTLVDEDA
jgi:hypothetical protein